MRTIVVLLAVLLLTQGCSDQPGGSADCTARIRSGEIVYTSYDTTRQPATEHGTAEEAECHDVGADADGSVFTDDAPTVTTWAFEGYSTDEVVGVRQGQHRYAVYIATSVSDAERDQLLAALRDRHGG